MSASLSVFEKEHSAREKYIYFICGLASALVAYIGKDYFPAHPFTWAEYLTLAALLLFFACFVSGCVYIIIFIKVTNLNRDALVIEEEIANIYRNLVLLDADEMLNQPRNIFRNLQTGKKYSLINKQELEDDVDKLKQKKDETRARMKVFDCKIDSWFIAAHCCLGLGFILMIIAKLIT